MIIIVILFLLGKFFNAYYIINKNMKKHYWFSEYHKFTMIKVVSNPDNDEEKLYIPPILDKINDKEYTLVTEGSELTEEYKKRFTDYVLVGVE